MHGSKSKKYIVLFSYNTTFMWLGEWVLESVIVDLTPTKAPNLLCDLRLVSWRLSYPSKIPVKINTLLGYGLKTILTNEI